MKAIIYDDFFECLSRTTFCTEGLTALSVRCIQPYQQQGRRMPSLSSVRTLSTCCLLVSGFFTEIAQHIHSLRARGVRSSHEALASASEARVFRKSSGNSWTTPPEISLLVIVIRLYYYKIASLARIAGANGVFNLPVLSRAELTIMVCKCSLVERLDLLPIAVLLMIGANCPQDGQNPLTS